MLPDAVDTFEQHREFITALAEKISGSRATGEDLVSQAFFRWGRLEHSEIRNPKAMLATIVTRLAITEKHSAHARREVTCDPSILSSLNEIPSENIDLSNALTLALDIVISRLTPTERAVFLLREVFECEYRDIAATLDESEANCRQLLRRAREKIGARGDWMPPEETTHAELALEQFLAATKSGQFAPLLELVCDEPVLVRDAGDIGEAAPAPVTGRDAILGYFEKLWLRMTGLTLSIRNISLQYQLAEFKDATGHLKRAYVAIIEEERIKSLQEISCPTKLRVLERIL
jgi:RNA polymerase sigma-70 factor (ECF subfamily)